MNGNSVSGASAFAFRRIMVASEGGAGLVPLTRFVLQFAAPDASVCLTDVICNPAALFPTMPLSFPDWSEAHRAMLHGAQLRLTQAGHEAATFIAQPDTELIDLAALHQEAAEALSRSARAWRADLIVVSSQPRGHRSACRLDPEELVAASHCPVLHMPAACLNGKDGAVSRVLVAADGSPPSLAALQVATNVMPKGAVFRLVYVMDRSCWLAELVPCELFRQHGDEALRRAQKVMESTSASAESAIVETEAAYDDVASAVLREAEQWHADLVVMSSSSKSKLALPLPGHVVAHTLRNAECPVLVCPAAIGATAENGGYRQPRSEAAVSPPMFL
jgi:nucleotide-binding universal stress UspA family protein